MGRIYADIVLVEYKTLLEYKGIFIARVMIASETEVTQTLNYIFVIIVLYFLNYMGMMPQNQVSTTINNKVPQS